METDLACQQTGVCLLMKGVHAEIAELARVNACMRRFCDHVARQDSWTVQLCICNTEDAMLKMKEMHTLYVTLQARLLRL